MLHRKELIMKFKKLGEQMTDEDVLTASGVIHPTHYNIDGRKECIDEMLDKFGFEFTCVFCFLNAYKYMYRAGLKDGAPMEKDKRKVAEYMEMAERIMENRKYTTRLAEMYVAISRMIFKFNEGDKKWYE